MNPNPSGTSDRQKPKLLDQLRQAIRTRHYSIRTEEAYVQWVKRFILFHNKRHPEDMGAPEINAFLSHLAVDNNVAASTQNQALCAILFLYKQVLDREPGRLEGVVRAKKPTRLPVVFTVEEVHAILVRLQGTLWLMASLLYGSGLRLMECVRLRVKDIDFQYRQLLVRDGKGQKDRVTMLPSRVIEPLKQHLARVKTIHKEDLDANLGAVYLPFALEKKYPTAAIEWGWQNVFPSSKISIDPRSGKERRHHIDETILQKAVKAAIRQAGIAKQGSCHSLRLQRICFRTVMTFERCRSFWVTAM